MFGIGTTSLSHWVHLGVKCGSAARTATATIGRDHTQSFAQMHRYLHLILACATLGQRAASGPFPERISTPAEWACVNLLKWVRKWVKKVPFWFKSGSIWVEAHFYPRADTFWDIDKNPFKPIHKGGPKGP